MRPFPVHCEMLKAVFTAKLTNETIRVGNTSLMKTLELLSRFGISSQEFKQPIIIWIYESLDLSVKQGGTVFSTFVLNFTSSHGSPR